jgi:hypothetical protein
MHLNEVIPHTDRRYMVGWEPREDREIVIVYDRFVQKIVYKANVSDRKLAYPKIQDFYGRNDCVPPKQVQIRTYE